MDDVRVLRIVEYIGPRDAVEEQIRKSLHGEHEGALSKVTGVRCTIRATTLGEYPDLMDLEPRKPPCINHPGRVSVTNLDSEDLCKECADLWVKGEGASQARDLDDEIPF